MIDGALKWNGVKMRKPIGGRVFLIYNPMEFYSGKTMFKTGQPPKSREETDAETSRALRELGPEFTPKVIAVVQDLARVMGITAPTEETTRLTKGLVWDVRGSQVAGSNLDASMLAFHAYLETVGKSVSPMGWKWAEGLSPEMRVRLSGFQESKEMVDSLLAYRMAREDGYGNRFGRGGGGYDRGGGGGYDRGGRYGGGDEDRAILSVVAADTPEPILAKTREWPDFEVDESGLRSAMSGPDTLAVAVRSKITVKEWSSVGCGVPDTFVSLGSKYSGSLLQLSQLEGNEVKVCYDAYGFATVSYTMSYGKFRVTVRVTDVTLATLATQGEDCVIPSYDALVASHQAQKVWDRDTRYSGATFNSFRMDVTQSIRHCLGAENGTWKITAAQAGGHVKINGDCPLNLDVKSVVVFRDRGWKSTPESVGEYLDFSHQDRGHFVNLVEVDIADAYGPGKALRVFDGLFSEEDACGND